MPVAYADEFSRAVAERMQDSDRDRGALTRPQRAPSTVDEHVETTLEDLVLLDLVAMDMGRRRHVSRRQHELHLHVLPAGLSSRSAHDVHAAVRHPELVTRRSHPRDRNRPTSTVARPTSAPKNAATAAV